MAARPRRITLLLITGSVIARADVEPASAEPLRRLAQGQRPPVDDIEAVIDTTFALSDEPPGTVWILCTDAAQARLEIQRTTLESLPVALLPNRLAQECEPLTGLPALDTVVAWRELAPQGIDRVFWVAQAPSAWWTAAQKLFTRRRLRLGGMLHPAGLPAQLGRPASGVEWQRIESWGPTTLTVTGDAVGIARFAVSAQPLAQVLREAHPDATLLIGPGQTDVSVELSSTEAGLPPAELIQRLDDPERLGAWCVAWAVILAGVAPGTATPVPILVAPPRPLALGAQLALALALWLVAAGLCWGHWQWSSRAAAPAQTADPVAEQKKLDERLAAVQAAIAAGEKAELERRGRRHRGALAMRAVGALTDDATTVVTAIQVDADRLSVAGVTVDAQAPSVLAERLDGQLVTVGWRMQDLQVHRSADSAVEAWDFSLIAGDPASAGARGATKPAAIKPAANRRATSP